MLKQNNSWNRSENRRNSSSIPRYERPGFKPISTPNSSGKIKSWNGGKLVNGVIKYPSSAKVDQGKAARAQAFMDYSYGKNGGGNSKMGKLYGQSYYDEIKRLSNLPSGTSAWGSENKRQSNSSKNRNDRYDGNDSYNRNDWNNSYDGSDYHDAFRDAQNAASNALKQQVEQGVNNIYAQKDSLDEQMRKSAQQMYVANMQSKKELPQQMAAQGLTGGASESANVALETGFGQGLNELMDYYNQSISQMDRDAANLRASGNLKQAQNVADFAKQLAQYAYQTQQHFYNIQSQKELAAYKSHL